MHAFEQWGSAAVITALRQERFDALHTSSACFGLGKKKRPRKSGKSENPQYGVQVSSKNLTCRLDIWLQPRLRK